jgi:hypothetical protein
MNRNTFLKKLAIATGAVAVTPQLLKAENSPPSGKLKLAIDIQSISGITIGGSRISPAEIIDIFHQTGFLLYVSHDKFGRRHNSPMIIDGEVEVIDIAEK